MNKKPTKRTLYKNAEPVKTTTGTMIPVTKIKGARRRLVKEVEKATKREDKFHREQKIRTRRAIVLAAASSYMKNSGHESAVRDILSKLFDELVEDPKARPMRRMKTTMNGSKCKIVITHEIRAKVKVTK